MKELKKFKIVLRSMLLLEKNLSKAGDKKCSSLHLLYFSFHFQVGKIL